MASSKLNLPFHQEANPRTKRRHRIELWWQILLPLTFIFALLFAGAYFLLSQQAPSIATMAQIGSMLLLTPIMLLTGILILIVLALIYLLAIVMNWIPPKAYRLQKLINQVNQRTRQAADLAAKPIIRIDSWTRAIRKSVDRFF